MKPDIPEIAASLTAIEVAGLRPNSFALDGWSNPASWKIAHKLMDAGLLTSRVETTDQYSAIIFTPTKLGLEVHYYCEDQYHLLDAQEDHS